MIEKFTVSNDKSVYEAWPDVVLTDSGKLVCVFSECTHHGNRDYTRIMLADSIDRGRTWSKKRPLTEGTGGQAYYYNCARISRLADGRLAVIVDRIPFESGERRNDLAVNCVYFSADDGESWSAPVETPLCGIVPDKLLELANGRWIISAHYAVEERLAQFLRYSDDRGGSWSEPVLVAADPVLNLCEVSILPMGGDVLVAFLRENSFKGYDCKKAISRDNGESWGPLIDFPRPGCHRPVAGHLRDGRILITYRFMHGGRGWLGSWTQNFFAALTDAESVTAGSREEASVRIMPVDYDRSPKSDLGYSGFAQFDDGEIYVVNYIVDDAVDKGQIRGYALRPEEFYLWGGEADRVQGLFCLWQKNEAARLRFIPRSGASYLRCFMCRRHASFFSPPCDEALPPAIGSTADAV